MADSWDESSNQSHGNYDGRSYGARSYVRGGGGNSYNRYEGGSGGGGGSYNRQGGGGPNSYNRREAGSSSYNSYEGRNNWRDNKNANTVEIEVPSRFIGRIIGRGGSKISSLQYESGAKINVTKDKVGDNTIVKISGSDDEIRIAQSLIEELAVDRSFPH